MHKIRALLFGLLIGVAVGLGYMTYLLNVFMSEPPPLLSGKTESALKAHPSAYNPPPGGSNNVQEGELIKRVEPEYPELARQMRWRPPFVRIQATVGKAGKIEEVRIARGHPLCNNAVRLALRQWEYTPTLLNGKPEPVMSELTLRCGDPYRGKLDPAVALLIDRIRSGGSENPMEKEFVKDGWALLEVTISSKSEKVTGRIENLGFEISSRSGNGILLVGRLPVSKLDALFSLPGISFIAPHSH